MSYVYIQNIERTQTTESCEGGCGNRNKEKIIHSKWAKGISPRNSTALCDGLCYNPSYWDYEAVETLQPSSLK
jgi:hypothetical protein